jgi:hypothetical protein
MSELYNMRTPYIKPVSGWVLCFDQTRVDLNNPDMVGPNNPCARWKRELLIYFGHRFDLRTFVETGTSRGDCIGHVRPHFDSVLSVELSPIRYEFTKKRFGNGGREAAANVHLFCGSSGRLLPDMIEQTQGPLLIWLDAHSDGAEDVIGTVDDYSDQIPSELDAIVRLRPESLVCIDDYGPDSIQPPQGWHKRYLHGMTVLHDGRYDIPERL